MLRSPEHMRLTGRRMREAREAAGLSTREMLELLQQRAGIRSTQTTVVSRWETGKHNPPRQVIDVYAEATGRPADWFWASSEAAGDVAEEVAAALVRIMGDVMAGRQPDEAYDAESQMPTWLNPRVRSYLREHADAMRGAIEEFAGRPWDAIEGAEKQRLLSEFVRRLLPEEDLGLRRGSTAPGPSQPPLGSVTRKQ